MKNFFKYLLAGGIFLSVLLISEAIYQFQNQDVQLRVYLELSKLFASYSKLNLAMNFLNKASDIRISQITQEYPGTSFPKKEDVLTPIYNQNLSEEYLSYIKTLDTLKLSQKDPVDWGKVYYTLGLSAHKNAEEQLVIPFWQTAIYLAPEWSYFHIELANFYLIKGEREETVARLDYCLQFKYPKSYCQWFINDHLVNDSPLEVGFLEKKINQEI